MILYIHVHPIGQLYNLYTQTHIDNFRAVATGKVGPVTTGPLFEAATTFLPVFTNSAARPAGRLVAMRPQLKELEIDSLKVTLPSLQSAKVS